ncbi:MAG TPA: VWA domain-containing protein [Isosphaeraceae bacterium]|nr:VWA domain-containing protein [Isosphaeraceae bacterium]
MVDIFARPEWLWGLLAAPALVAWVASGRRRRARDWLRLGQTGKPRGDAAWGWLAAIVCLILALAQPRWGQIAGGGLPPGHDVVLLLDVSRSMAAQDAIPNRLGVASEAAESLVAALGKAEGSRAAVVAFAGRGAVRCPLTENMGAVVSALHTLRPGQILPGGTDLGAALETALDAFDEEDHTEGRSIILLSDGEDHAGTWNEFVPRLKAAGIVVHSVAIGDADRAHPVPSGVGSEPLTYQGEPVASRRTDAAFEALAQATGGAVVKLGLAAADLGGLYASRIAPVAKRQRELLRSPNRAERYPAFVLGALSLGLAGSWPGRRRWRWWWGRRPRLLAWLILLTAMAGPAASPPQETAAEAVASGRKAYAARDFGGAVTAFERAIALDPDSAVPRYDAAAALFQLGRYQEAFTRYSESRSRADAALRTKIDYALGNSALAMGEIIAALGHYDDCLASRVPGDVYDAVRRDAAINRRFAQQQALNQSLGPSEDPESPSPAAKKSQPPPDSGAGSRPSTPQKGAAADGAPPSGRRGPGGAGGAGQTSAPPGSPESRLASALENIRDAQRRRLPDEPPPPAANVDSKEW